MHEKGQESLARFQCFIDVGNEQSAKHNTGDRFLDLVNVAKEFQIFRSQTHLTKLQSITFQIFSHPNSNKATARKSYTKYDKCAIVTYVKYDTDPMAKTEISLIN